MTEKKLLTVSQKNWYRLVLCYVYTGLLIFILGWIKLTISIPLCIIIFSALKMVWDCDFSDDDSFIELDIKCLIFIILIVLIIGYYCGWGGFVPQAGDWRKHNTIMTDLVKNVWPVYYQNDTEQSMLTYYIGQYLVPASVGKAGGYIFGDFEGTGVRIAYFAQYIWNCSGLCLVMLGVLGFLKIKKISHIMLNMFIVVFFGNLLQIGQKVYCYITDSLPLDSKHWLTNVIRIQYTTNFAQLRWVYPQCLVTWLLVLLFLLNRKKYENYIVWFLPLLLYASLPFVGLILLLFSVFVYDLIITKEKKKLIIRTLSIQNILILLSVGTILFLYFIGNLLGDKPESIRFNIIQYDNNLIIYFLFVFFTVGIYYMLLFKSFRNDILFWITLIELFFICPSFSMGKYNDFTMRTSIPALFILMIYVCKNIFENKKNINKILVIAIVVLGMYYPGKEFIYCIKIDNILELNESKECYPSNSMKYFANRKKNYKYEKGLQYNYYTYDLQYNIFYNYFARKKIKQ